MTPRPTFQVEDTNGNTVAATSFTVNPKGTKIVAVDITVNAPGGASATKGGDRYTFG